MERSFRSLMKRMGGGPGNAMTFGKSNAKIYAESETGITFADVAGEEEAKDALKEIVDFLHKPEKYSEIGAVLPKGALLVGPPGTGKTMLAKAVAGEAHVPFFSISGSEFVEMFVGMGAAKVRDLFKQANEKAPCIVFIDEIDTIGKKRDGAGMGGNDEREQTLNQLLTEMDGFDGKKGVVILAATNRPESLDPALLRPGRFDRRIPVELPDLKGREAILKVHGKKVKVDESVDYNEIARATNGASGAELANIVNEAALRAVRMGRKTVSQQDLEESVETVIAGYQKKDAGVSGDEKKTGLGLEKEQIEDTVYELLLGDCTLEDCLMRDVQENLDVLPSDSNLAGAEIELLDVENKESVLNGYLETIRDQYDFIIIDCPPSLSLLTINALVAADTVLVPIQCEYYALEGLSQVLRTIGLVRKKMNPSLELEGVVFTMYDARTNLSLQVVENVKQNLNERIYKTIIPRNVRLAEAPSHGMPINLYDSRSTGAESYRLLAAEVISRGEEL